LFRGVSLITLDVKGRLGMPTRHRERLETHFGNELVITIDTDERCLLVYPTPQWEEIERSLSALPGLNKHARRIQRLLVGHATDCDMDSHGRILVPPPLREYAGLEKRVVLIGQGKKFELWDETRWNERREAWLEEETPEDLELPPELVSLAL